MAVEPVNLTPPKVEDARPAEEKWPAVALAYEFVRPSYDVMLKRFEVVEGRIRSIITLMATLTLGAPVFIKTWSGSVSYASPWFIAAISIAGFILLVGAFASTFGSLTVLDPDRLHDGAMSLSKFNFQRIALRDAAKDFKRNRTRLAKKARTADLMAVALVAEIIVMAVWASSAA